MNSRLLAAAIVLLGTTSAQALTIKLTDTGGVTGSPAEQGFKIAAHYWEKVLTNNVTVNLNVGYAALGPGILGSTSSPRVGVFTSDVETLLALGGNSTLDARAVAHLPGLNAAGALNVITNGYKNAAKQGVNTAQRVFDADSSANNFGLAITRANAKALGFTGLTGPDASITFSNQFAFDFDPSNGIANNSYDFIGVAIHEIGHALGFVSGVDTYDSFGGPNGPNRGSNTNLNNFVINSVLDLYRYTDDPFDIAPGGGPVLDWSVGGSPYFSIDGGASPLTLGTGAGYFSTGTYNGDGRQASHWKDNTYAGGADCSNPTKTPIGILDPTSGRCEILAVSALDLAAFDAIGWNVRVNPLWQADYRFTTGDIFAASGYVPEPASWAMLIAGFGLTGAAMRRRKAAVAA